jgi:hypothetical protein
VNDVINIKIAGASDRMVIKNSICMDIATSSGLSARSIPRVILGMGV